MKKASEVRVYFAAKGTPNRGKYEIYLDGKTTGLMVGPSTVRKFLSRSQYNDFLKKGYEIFMVPKTSVKHCMKHITAETVSKHRQINGLA